MGRLDGSRGYTGATSGIGLRTAEIFVAEGAQIVIRRAGARRKGEALAEKLAQLASFADRRHG